ncbi:SIMPL domain-containing protein [bacterium]|nr:SIMPL domain-containing protein [bacterium]
MTKLKPAMYLTMFCLLIFLITTSEVSAQLSGSRGGSVHGNTAGDGSPDALTAEDAQSFIEIEGKAVLSVEPTSIRIVLALTSEAVSSAECKTKIQKQIAALREQWKEAGMKEEDIVEDFISLLPSYEFQVETLKEKEVMMEKKVGYLMQSNVHLAVKDDKEAMKMLDVAFANNVTDIIGFDYWSKDLDQKKKETRALAVEAAKEKASVLLGDFFEKKPPIINVREKTDVRYPASMYESFTNSSSGQYQTNYSSKRNLPVIKLARPQNTYYRGNLPSVDVQADTMPMQAEISIVSTVRIYYESPAAKSYNASRDD